MLNFLEYLANNTKLIIIWNKLPLSTKKITYSVLLNIWLFPVVFYKIYYSAISIIYQDKELQDITLENLKSSKYIKKTNYDLIVDALLKSNLFVFDIRNDYHNICVLINNKKELLNFFNILKKNAYIYISFESKLGRTIPSRLFFIPTFLLNYLLSLSDSFLIYQRYRSGTNRLLFSDIPACKLEVWINHDEYYKHKKNKHPFKIGSREWLTKNNYSVKKKVQDYYNIEKHTDFPIDFVYTWVNNEDPQWLNNFNDAIKNNKDKSELLKSSVAPSRYLNRDELKYSLRSICMYADFFRKIFIVTSGQIPAWLNSKNPKIEIVKHKDIFPDSDCLPTFNSHAIESRLHHIKELSEHFIYYNDDFFIGRTISINLFFVNKNLSYIFPINSRFIDLAETNELELPADAAAKNNRDIILNEFDLVVTEYFMHTPYILRKSILFEIEDKFSSIFSLTAKNKFRNIKDISTTSSLYQHYSYVNGLSTQGNINHHYIDIAKANLEDKLNSLLYLKETQRPDAFCINELDISNEDLEHKNILVRNFLENYFPLKSEFEK